MFKETDDIVCTACNVMDIGTVIAESDVQAHVVLTGTNTAALQEQITDLVREIESDPAEIILQQKDDTTMDMVINFSCAAEKLIFEMRASRMM